MARKVNVPGPFESIDVEVGDRSTTVRVKTTPESLVTIAGMCAEASGAIQAAEGRRRAAVAARDAAKVRSAMAESTKICAPIVEYAIGRDSYLELLAMCECEDEVHIGNATAALSLLVSEIADICGALGAKRGGGPVTEKQAAHYLEVVQDAKPEPDEDVWQ